MAGCVCPQGRGLPPLIHRMLGIAPGVECIAEKMRLSIAPMRRTVWWQRQVWNTIISNWSAVRNCSRFFKGENAGERGGTGSSRACVPWWGILLVCFLSALSEALSGRYLENGLGEGKKGNRPAGRWMDWEILRWKDKRLWWWVGFRAAKGGRIQDAPQFSGLSSWWKAMRFFSMDLGVWVVGENPRARSQTLETH